MDESEGGSAGEGRHARAIFPPDIASVLRGLLGHHRALATIDEQALATILTSIFFASLKKEEHEHYPIRVALMADADRSARLRAHDAKLLLFEHPYPCTTQNLLRLARAARAERLYLTVSQATTGPVLTGLMRERFEPDDPTLKVRAPDPGCLEVWSAGQRILEYVHGHIQAAPEDVLLSSGRVRERVLAFARAAGAPTGYVEAVSSIVRHLAAHPHGGILVLSAQELPTVPAGASFTLQPDRQLWDTLHRLAVSIASERPSDEPSSSLLRSALRAEIEDVVAEIGGMTALDGATILDRRLGVRGFGVVLPVRAQVPVIEMMDAASTMQRPFDLQQFGARHRAAASHAALHPSDLVFIASTTDNIGCMLCDEHTSDVMLWRFRASDLASRV
jgi:hypothetical protein